MEEEWRPVVGWEGFYEVSSLGRVKSLSRTVTYRDGRRRFQEERILRPGVTKSKYHVVVLRKSGISRSSNVHRLVAEAFLPNPEGLPLVRHLNDLGTHNQVSNLAWGTYSENRRDAVASGAYVNQYHRVEKCIRGHLFSEENTYKIRTGGRACKECRRLREKGLI